MLPFEVAEGGTPRLAVRLKNRCIYTIVRLHGPNTLIVERAAVRRWLHLLQAAAPYASSDRHLRPRVGRGRNACHPVFGAESRAACAWCVDLRPGRYARH